jgi:signal peptidase I
MNSLQDKTFENVKTKGENEWKSLLLVIVFAFSIRIFVFEPFYVPTGSMKETIREGDYIFSTKFSYGYSNYSFPWSPNLFEGRIFASSPQRGDIIIFRPPFDMNTRYIKRLIGIPGDKVQVINDVIYINDKPIERQDLGTFVGSKGEKYRRFKETLPGGASYLAYKSEELADYPMINKYSTTPPFYVPSGKYFFMGDNRDNSRDSRADLGFVPFENFIAKGQFRFFSTEEPLFSPNGNLLDFVTRFGIWVKSIRFNRIFTSIYNYET